MCMWEVGGSGGWYVVYVRGVGVWRVCVWGVWCRVGVWRVCGVGGWGDGVGGVGVYVWVGCMGYVGKCRGYGDAWVCWVGGECP